MDILRQDHEISVEEQRAYAEEYFEQTKWEHPLRALFRYWVRGVMYGYGGLVHIDWIGKSAETSFLVNPSLKKDLLSYATHYLIFLQLLRAASKQIGIEEWTSETFTDTGDHTRDLHIVLQPAIFRDTKIIMPDMSTVLMRSRINASD